jgi:hypothetical protein
MSSAGDRPEWHPETAAKTLIEDGGTETVEVALVQRLAHPVAGAVVFTRQNALVQVLVQDPCAFLRLVGRAVLAGQLVAVAVKDLPVVPQGVGTGCSACQQRGFQQGRTRRSDRIRSRRPIMGLGDDHVMRGGVGCPPAKHCVWFQLGIG